MHADGQRADERRGRRECPLHRERRLQPDDLGLRQRRLSRQRRQIQRDGRARRWSSCGSSAPARATAATAAARPGRARATTGRTSSHRQPREHGGTAPAAHDAAGAGALQREHQPMLLTDNGNGNSSVKQVELCSYCHTNARHRRRSRQRRQPAGRGQHVLHALAAEDAGQRGLGRRPAAGPARRPTATTTRRRRTRAGIDFSWNGNTTTNTTACIMCHADIHERGHATGLTHQAHLTTTTGGGNARARTATRRRPGARRGRPRRRRTSTARSWSPGR